MTKKVLALLSLVFLLSANAQQGSWDTSGLSDADWSKRYSALKKILASSSALDNESVKDALVECLEREDRIIDEPAVMSELAENETYADNYLNLLSDTVMHIAQTSNSQRAFDALVKSGYNPSSPFGKVLAARAANLPALIEATSSRNLGLRSEAMGVIGMMLRSFKEGQVGPISPETHRRAKEVLAKAAASATEDGFVRRAAIEALGMIADKDDLPLLEFIAASDPEIANDEGGEGRFATREEALKSIRAIRRGTTQLRRVNEKAPEESDSVKGASSAPPPPE